MTHQFLNGTNPDYLTGKCITVYIETKTQYFFASNRFISLQDAKEGIKSGKYLAASETSVKNKIIYS